MFLRNFYIVLDFETNEIQAGVNANSQTSAIEQPFEFKPTPPPASP